EIVDSNGGVVALWVRHGPLLELHVLGAEHDHQATGPDDSVFFLKDDRNKYIVSISRHQVGIFGEVDTLGKKETKRRLGKRIDILGRKTPVTHDDRRAVGDQFNRARIVVFKTHPAGLRDKEVTLRTAAIGTHLDKISGESLNAGQIAIHPLDDCTLLGGEIAGRARLTE